MLPAAQVVSVEGIARVAGIPGGRIVVQHSVGCVAAAQGGIGGTFNPKANR